MEKNMAEIFEFRLPGFTEESVTDYGDGLYRLRQQAAALLDAIKRLEKEGEPRRPPQASAPRITWEEHVARFAALALPDMVLRPLFGSGIHSIDDLTKLTETKLKSIKGMGKVRLDYIQAALAAHGLSLADEDG
jgi:DNA-directed RNA polymerase alpha subunit